MYIFLPEGKIFIKGHEQPQDTTKKPQELVYYAGGNKAPKKQKVHIPNQPWNHKTHKNKELILIGEGRGSGIWKKIASSTALRKFIHSA